jgi:hypothetical protein
MISLKGTVRWVCFVLLEAVKMVPDGLTWHEKEKPRLVRCFLILKTPSDTMLSVPDGGVMNGCSEPRW